jgi:hypothetical protein
MSMPRGRARIFADGPPELAEALGQISDSSGAAKELRGVGAPTEPLRG